MKERPLGGFGQAAAGDHAVVVEAHQLGCLSLDRCKLANPGDIAGGRGPGARYWIGDPRPAS